MNRVIQNLAQRFIGATFGMLGTNEFKQDLQSLKQVLATLGIHPRPGANGNGVNPEHIEIMASDPGAVTKALREQKVDYALREWSFESVPGAKIPGNDELKPELISVIKPELISVTLPSGRSLEVRIRKVSKELQHDEVGPNGTPITPPSSQRSQEGIVSEGNRNGTGVGEPSGIRQPQAVRVYQGNPFETYANLRELQPSGKKRLTLDRDNVLQLARMAVRPLEAVLVKAGAMANPLSPNYKDTGYKGYAFRTRSQDELSRSVDLVKLLSYEFSRSGDPVKINPVKLISVEVFVNQNRPEALEGLKQLFEQEGWKVGHEEGAEKLYVFFKTEIISGKKYDRPFKLPKQVDMPITIHWISEGQEGVFQPAGGAQHDEAVLQRVSKR